MARSTLAPVAHTTHGEGTTMHYMAQRATIAAAAVAAAGLFGCLAQEGTPIAAQGARAVHADVTLVDASSAAATPDALGTAEIVYNNGIYSDLVGPNGFEDSLWTAYEPNGNTIFDSTGTGAIFPVAGDIGGVPVTAGGYLNVFDGGETQLYDAYLADSVAVEDEVNNLLGASSSDQAALLANFDADYITPVNQALPTIPLGADFDSTLSSLAGTDDQAALADFSTFTEYFLNNLASFSSDGFLTEAGLTAELTALENLGSGFATDFSALLTSLFSSL